MKQENTQGFIKCARCFEVNYAKSQRCVHCSFKLNPSKKHFFTGKLSLIERIKQILVIEKYYPLSGKDYFNAHESNFFSRQEIEMILSQGNIKILMFVILDDIHFLDEAALIQFGDLLMTMDTIKLQAVVNKSSPC